MSRSHLVAILLAVLPAPLLAQHEGPHHSAHSPYADAEVDAASGLPLDELEQLRAGEGMGLALVAELNRYPGPRHAIELSGELRLTESQLAELRRVRSEMTRAAMSKGQDIIEVESELARRFGDETVTRESVGTATRRIGRLRADLRAIHLRAHLETREILTDQQVHLYGRLRGYH